MANLLGYTKQELIGSSIYNYVPPESINNSISKVHSRVLGQPVDIYRNELVHKNGQIIPIQVYVKVVELAGKQMTLSFNFDISDQLKVEKEQLVLQQQMSQIQKIQSLGILAGGIAHDFNNLLMVIQGGLDVLSHSLLFF